MSKLCIGSTQDLQHSLRHVLTLRGKHGNEYLSIVLFRFAGEGGTLDRFYSIVQECPHLGANMETAEVEIEESGDVYALCPYHQYDFSLTTGKSSTGMTACTWPVTVEEDSVYLDMEQPYTLLNIRPVSEAFATASVPTLDSLSLSEAEEPATLTAWVRLIMLTPQPDVKVSLTRRLSHLFRTGQLTKIGNTPPPDEPARLSSLNQIAPSQSGKRGKGGSLRSRIALLHSLANIEQYAIDLALDIISRFAQTKVNGKSLPLGFFSDFLKVAEDEAKHFTLLSERLVALGSEFGALPIHSGLWQSARDTSHSLISRLCTNSSSNTHGTLPRRRTLHPLTIEQVHEARGLDVNPTQIARVKAAGDLESAAALTTIHCDEITHVMAGHKWHTFLCANQAPPVDPIQTFRDEVKAHFHGSLKPPFNVEDRAKAGLSGGYYEDLVNKHVTATDSRHIERAAAGG